LTVRVSRQARSDLPIKTVRQIAERVFAGEKRRVGGILSIVLTDDAAIRGLNLRFLKRDRPTDVIAFPIGDVNGIWGEVYVSVDRTRQHAKDYGVPPEEELARCVIHGVLHLLGYDDGTVRQWEEMKGKEEEYLRKTKNFI
jgi:probable rRNA maturation factor